MTSGELFQPIRECCACHRTAAAGSKRLQGEPNIVAVSMTLYRRGAGKGAIRAAGKVTICEECLVKALAPSVFGVGREGIALLAGIRERLSRRYSAMLEDDAQ